MLMLNKLWSRVANAPTWLWGVVAGAGSLAWMFLRMRAAEEEAKSAEHRAAEAELDAGTADTSARAELALERASELAEERKEVAAETAEHVADAGAMTDEEANAWTRRDAERRLRDKGEL